ncbi:hypothetical protein [Halohasta salina]|uniref:hypothetical protein n=1 Tax=Halohasta salina TaxID=2961621 RepID=UPI0020A24FCC|nr:hypothetical protein [Halohasta salina]
MSEKTPPTVKTLRLSRSWPQIRLDERREHRAEFRDTAALGLLFALMSVGAGAAAPAAVMSLFAGVQATRWWVYRDLYATDTQEAAE